MKNEELLAFSPGKLKLSDFGSAINIGDKPKVFMSTLDYLAPGNLKTSYRSITWASSVFRSTNAMAELEEEYFCMRYFFKEPYLGHVLLLKNSLRV